MIALKEYGMNQRGFKFWVLFLNIEQHMITKKKLKHRGADNKGEQHVAIIKSLILHKIILKCWIIL